MDGYSLNGKVALVTGAARGIGFETARQMHMRGASVAVLDLDPGQAAEAAERIGARAAGIGADVTDQGAMMAAVAEVTEKFGGLDVAVANAGIAQSQFATAQGISGEEWERVFEVDLLGVWRTVRAALPQIVERRGQMVVISSVYAFANGFGNTPYAVAKSGVESLGRALRVELAPTAPAPRSPTSAGSTPNSFRTPSTSPSPTGSATSAPTSCSSGSPRRTPAPASSAASRNALPASSCRSGGATSPPCAASSTPCWTAAWRTTPRPRR